MVFNKIVFLITLITLKIAHRFTSEPCSPNKDSSQSVIYILTFLSTQIRSHTLIVFWILPKDCTTYYLVYFSTISFSLFYLSILLVLQVYEYPHTNISFELIINLSFPMYPNMTITIILITAEILSDVWFVNTLPSQKPEPKKKNNKEVRTHALNLYGTFLATTWQTAVKLFDKGLN